MDPSGPGSSAATQQPPLASEPGNMDCRARTICGPVIETREDMVPAAAAAHCSKWTWRDMDLEARTIWTCGPGGYGPDDLKPRTIWTWWTDLQQQQPCDRVDRIRTWKPRTHLDPSEDLEGCGPSGPGSSAAACRCSRVEPGGYGPETKDHLDHR
ncbi:hypothetical protein AVEN_121535-1 [Araneus ventricosus]|uniref:Uncharacterized protein n=1 Tax=Araneus ventricosus TaxID=182803 RepID=A0A4Y2GR90_ARAVE|nr:hypothetical protein AVEN_121535-1 [Araneus ventricosus]